MSRAEKIKKRLKKWHARAVREGDEANITLLKKDNSAVGQGAFANVVAPLSDYWVLEDVRNRAAFGQFEPENQLAKRFRIAQDQLTLAQAHSVAAILHGNWRYTVELGDEPHNTSRYWVFKVLEREKV